VIDVETADDPTVMCPICGGLATDATYPMDQVGEPVDGAEPTTLTLRICENIYCAQHDPRTALR
jgi:hypothetical protein